MAARITRAGAAPAYFPPKHQGVDAVRLQGVEAGPTEAFWVGLSTYHPGGAAEMSPTAAETVYVVVDGSFELTLDDPDRGVVTEQLHAGDSLHMPQGTHRAIANAGEGEAHLLVIIANPRS